MIRDSRGRNKLEQPDEEEQDDELTFQRTQKEEGRRKRTGNQEFFIHLTCPLSPTANPLILTFLTSLIKFYFFYEKMVLDKRVVVNSKSVVAQIQRNPLFSNYSDYRENRNINVMVVN